MLTKLLTIIIFTLLLVLRPALGGDSEAKKNSFQIPREVSRALKAKFPQAEIVTWSREKENGVVLYDIEFKEGDVRKEADIRADGTIDNWEKAIAVSELPEAVKKAVDTKYPFALIREIMAVTAVKKGKDALSEYEIVLQSAAKRIIELKVSVDGQILENSEEKK